MFRDSVEKTQLPIFTTWGLFLRKAQKRKILELCDAFGWNGGVLTAEL